MFKADEEQLAIPCRRHDHNFALFLDFFRARRWNSSRDEMRTATKKKHIKLNRACATLLNCFMKRI
jgi:hypothetical protein